MNNAGGGRHLPILAAVLLLVSLAVVFVLLIIRIPDERRFEESILSASFSLEEGSEMGLKRDLLRASRYAASAEQWKEVLRIAASGTIAPAGDSRDFRLFRTLAGRASASVPGDQDLLACWVWALLRTGSTEKAFRHQKYLTSPEWSTLRAEIRLVEAHGGKQGAVDAFLSELRSHDDPEFLESAALLTESAELTFDAALLWMMHGRPQKAYENVEALGADKREWAFPDALSRMGVAEAAARIAYDSGRTPEAIEWLEIRVADAKRRRVDSWPLMQFLGDLHWNAYVLNAEERHRESAAEAWRESMDILRESAGETGYPEGAWRIWINSSAAAESAGLMRDRDFLLDEALNLFPDVPEVKAAWARSRSEKDPALARRLVRSGPESIDDPVLGAASVMVDPKAVSPRLYEARMWEFFDASTADGGGMEEADARMITAFVLDYMASRKNLDSVDVAVDRYRKAYPDDSWILSWRLAADAVRGITLVDLLPRSPEGSSPYEEFRAYASENRSWRALHDAALFGYHAAEALTRGADYFGPGGGSIDESIMEGAVAAILESPVYSAYRDDSPSGDRIGTLLRNRRDLEGTVDLLSSRGRRGRTERFVASATLRGASVRVLENALEDSEGAAGALGKTEGNELAGIRYLEALILLRLGRDAEAANRAAMAVDADPDHHGARELLHRGTS